MIIRYLTCKPMFNTQTKSLVKKYKKTDFADRNVQFEDFHQSVIRASHYMRNYRGKAQFYEKIIISFLSLALIATIVTSICLGFMSHWGYSIVAVITFLIVGFIVNKIIRNLQNRYLRQGHFMLGLICRCENNRIYLTNNIEMRPGFQGKWIEFITYHDSTDINTIL